MKYSELKQHLDACLKGVQKYDSVYIVGGCDAYLRGRAVALFKSLPSAEYADFNCCTVSRDDGVSRAMDALEMYPVFDEIKVVIIPDLSDKLTDQEKEFLRSYGRTPHQTNLLIAVCEGDIGKAFAKSAELTYVDCDKLDENGIAAEVAGILSKPGDVTIGKAAIHALAEKTQSDMSRISMEIEKLKCYSEGEITVADVETMVVPDLEFAVYELTGAVSEKQADKALVVLDVFSKQGVDADRILTMLYNQYRKMLQAELHKGDDEKTLSELLGVSSGALYHLKRVSKNYSQLRLKKSADYLHSLQCDIRSGKRTDTTALHEAVLTLLNL